MAEEKLAAMLAAAQAAMVQAYAPYSKFPVGAALLGAIVVGLAGWVGSWLIGPRGRINIIINRQ